MLVQPSDFPAPLILDLSNVRPSILAVYWGEQDVSNLNLGTAELYAGSSSVASNTIGV
jgi:hypothetical protein